MEISSIKEMVKTSASEINNDELSQYVETLKMHVDNGEISDAKLIKVIGNFPSPISIRQDLSNEEGNILFESVRWAWKEITGQDIKTEIKTEHGPETLMGNYWMMKNGVLIRGPNHFTIIKKNADMFSRLLNIGAWAMQEKFVSPPNDLIKMAIDNGAMRIFVTMDGRAYFQLSSETYGEWGKKKIKNLEFKEKVVKVIDPNYPFSGWSTGITIKL